MRRRRRWWPRAAHRGASFGVSYYRRLYPKLIRAKQLIEEGAIGRPLLAEANCHSWLEIQGREWLSDPALAGGGPLYDIASHRIDAMNFLFGKVERASGLLSNAVHRMGVEDSATVLMGLPGGVHAVIDVRWNSRVARDQFRIIGEEGEINLDPLNSPELRVTTREESRVENCRPTPTCTIPLVENFVDAVLANDPSPWPAPRAGRMGGLDNRTGSSFAGWMTDIDPGSGARTRTSLASDPVDEESIVCRRQSFRNGV